MPATSNVAAARAFVRRHDILALAFLSFVALMFLSPYTRIYRLVFYLAVIPAFALTLDRSLLLSITRSWVWRFASVLLAYLWFRTIWTEAASWRDVFEMGRRGALILLFVTMTAYLIAGDPKFERRLFRWIAVAAAAAALVAIAWYVIQPSSWQMDRVGVLPFPNSNVSGAVYGTVAIGVLFCLLTPDLTGRERWVLAVAAAIMTLFVILTESRGTTLALAASVGCVAILSGNRSVHYALLAIILSYGLLVALGVVNMGLQLERGVSYRPEAWRQYLDLWAERPWFGIGLKLDLTLMSPEGAPLPHPHSVYVSYLTFGGVPALALLLLMLSAAARTAVGVWTRDGRAGLLAMLLFILISGAADFGVFVDNAQWQWLYFWLPLGLIAGAEATATAADARGSMLGRS